MLGFILDFISLTAAYTGTVKSCIIQQESGKTGTCCSSVSVPCSKEYGCQKEENLNVEESEVENMHQTKKD